MAPLKPLEFRDCVVDGPHFRSALQNHEKELKYFSKRAKDVYSNAERVFKAMDQLQQTLSDFATSLSRCYIDTDEPSELDTFGSCTPDRSFDQDSGIDVAETDDERVIKTALVEFAKIIHSVEEARKTMLSPIKQTVLAEINELRSTWLVGSKTDPKAFLKETTSFCQKLEKYLSTKQKDQSAELDEQMRQDRQRFISQAFEHVTNIHEAEERKKSKFVQTISLFMQMLANFYHQAYEQFQDSQHMRNAINQATQRSAENFAQISLETKVLKDKLLQTPWEHIQSVDSASFREGYLFVLNKKAMTTFWTKHFCTYKRDVKQLDMIPYSQGRSASDVMTEQYSVKSCIRRSSESIDRRFCFDVEVENKSTPLTLQAQSPDDLVQWLQIMEGQEPQYADRTISVVDPDRTFLSPQSYKFFCNLLEAIEQQGLHSSGLYRICGVKSKISSLICQALSPGGVSMNYLLECDIHLLTSTVKHFVRHLDEPLMTFELHDDFMAAVKRSPEERLNELRRLLELLPQNNREVLAVLMHHLAKVASNSARNNMTSSNLAIVFAPSLMRSREESVAAIMNTKFSSTAVELMIENCDSLFPHTFPPTVDGTKTSSFIEPVYSTPVVHNPTDPPMLQLMSDSWSYSFGQTSSRNRAPNRAASVCQNSTSSPNTVTASGDHLTPDAAVKPAVPRRIHSANVAPSRASGAGREPIRRKPTAPPAPNHAPRPMPVVLDKTRSSQNHSIEQQMPCSESFLLAFPETNQDNRSQKDALSVIPPNPFDEPFDGNNP